MKIGIIGSGNVGGTLGKRWAQAGHSVLFGTRNPGSEKMKELVDAGGATAMVVPIAEAVQAEVILLATPWGATRQALEEAGPLSGKLLIDATNPLLPQMDGFEYGNSTSGGEQVSVWTKGATVVKAFNTVGFNVMENPKFGDKAALLFYCGDDQAAKEQVHHLALELGFDPRDAGPLSQARLLEPFALLWISLVQTQGYGREIGFQLLQR